MKYKVVAKEIYEVTYLIDAESEDEAREKAIDQDGKIVRNEFDSFFLPGRWEINEC